MSYTFSVLEVSPEAYHEIRQKLEEAGYGHAIHETGCGDETIDMHGIALAEEADGAGDAWEAFREAGLLWWVNRTLHVFGWAIVCTVDDDGTVTAVRPERVRYRGFSREDEADGFEAVAHYLADNAHKLEEEATESEEET